MLGHARVRVVSLLILSLTLPFCNSLDVNRGSGYSSPSKLPVAARGETPNPDFLVKRSSQSISFNLQNVNQKLATIDNEIKTLQDGFAKKQWTKGSSSAKAKAEKNLVAQITAKRNKANAVVYEGISIPVERVVLQYRNNQITAADFARDVDAIETASTKVTWGPNLRSIRPDSFLDAIRNKAKTIQDRDATVQKTAKQAHKLIGKDKVAATDLIHTAKAQFALTALDLHRNGGLSPTVSDKSQATPEEILAEHIRIFTENLRQKSPQDFLYRI